MDSSLSEECVSIVADTHMTMLQDEAISEEFPEISDDIEDLHKSLRESVHDEAVQPKLQCLMMDTSFSMVTVQGEDSGIQWETTPSRCSTPRVNDCGTSTFESCPSVMPTSGAAGRIIIIMDEDKIVRRKRTKETGSGRRSRADRKTPLSTVEVSGDATGRPELVEVSQPNVKAEGEEEETADPAEEKRQRLFRLVSEGSEILNIVVPPKLASVDEEESKVMEDNLSYLEETPVTKLCCETVEEVFDPSIGVTVSGQVPTESTDPPGASQPTGPLVTDPPGAPVTRPPRRGAVGDMDYFETFTPMDSQAAPGSPAAALVGPEETEAGEVAENRTSVEPEQPKESDAPLSADQGSSEAVSGEEIASEHLDEVFYGGTDNVIIRSFLEGGDQSAPPKSPLKESGSALFGSQEDILTPIFLSPGPPKIIDPALLDEPTAMAFLYTDLYEEAVGSRQKDEDAESMTSERSFHSRHSDREDRGYLEKFVLKDETPVVEMEPTEEDPSKKEGFRKWSEDSYDLGGGLSQEAEKKGDVPGSEEEITDFLRTSASSSPCDTEPFPPPLEGEVDVRKPKKKEKVKTEGKDSQKAQHVAQPQAEASGETLGKESVAQVTDHNELPMPSTPTDEAGGKSVPQPPVVAAGSLKLIPPAQVQVKVPVQPSSESDSGITSQAPKPVAPLRRKTVLELAPLTPVGTTEKRVGVAEGEKEQRKEEKETASPAETADEGEGDGEETEKVDIPSSHVTSQDALPSTADNDVFPQEVTQVSESELAKGEDIYNETEEQKTNECPGGEDETIMDESCEREPAGGETGAATTDSEPAESAKIEVEPETRGARATALAEKRSVTDPAKETGRCIIL